MLSVRQLRKAIDSLGDPHVSALKRTEGELSRTLDFITYDDSTWLPPQKMNLKKVKSFEDLIPDSIRSTVYDRSQSAITNAKTSIGLTAVDYDTKTKIVRKHWIELNRKFSLSFACIVLFMIGAPLGSIIRKGGLGTPLIFAIAFFVLFNTLNTFGEKFAKEGQSSIFIGMWLSAMVLMPIGIFLTYKAMHDSQLFNKEFYFRFFKKIRGKK
jgi:lipopolysaccharide export system permease protein